MAGSDISPVAQTMSEGAPTRLEETEVLNASACGSWP